MSYGDGEEGQVIHESYTMGKSVEAQNNKEMNNLMGYHVAADRANTQKYPSTMHGEKRNVQLMNGVPGRYDYPKSKK